MQTPKQLTSFLWNPPHTACPDAAAWVITRPGRGATLAKFSLFWWHFQFRLSFSPHGRKINRDWLTIRIMSRGNPTQATFYRGFPSFDHYCAITVPVPRGQRPGRRCRVCARLWGWTQSAQCRSPIRRYKAPFPPVLWPPTHALDAELNCTERWGERKHLVTTGLLECVCVSYEGFALWDEMNTLSLWWVWV